MPRTKYPQPFVNFITRKGENKELRDRISKVYENEPVGVQRTLFCILNSLMWSKSVAISRSRNFYKENSFDIKYSHSMRAQEILLRDNFVDLKRGTTFTGASTLTARKELGRLIGDILIQESQNENPATLFEREPLGVVEPQGLINQKILEKADKTTKKINEALEGVQLSFEEGHIFRSIFGRTYDEVFNTTKWFQRYEYIPLPRKVQLTRMFSHDGHGRYYQLHHGAYHHQPKVVRQYLELNNMKTLELDYSSMNVQLACFIAGETPPQDDVYLRIADKLGLDEQSRDAIKKYVISTLHGGNKSNSHVARTAQREFWHLKERGVNPLDVREELLRQYPKFIMFTKEKLSNLSMYIESKIMTKILSYGLLQQNIPMISIHDGVRIPIQYIDQVKSIMEHSFEEVTKNKAQVKVTKYILWNEQDKVRNF